MKVVIPAMNFYGLKSFRLLSAQLDPADFPGDHFREFRNELDFSWILIWGRDLFYMLLQFFHEFYGFRNPFID